MSQLPDMPADAAFDRSDPFPGGLGWLRRALVALVIAGLPALASGQACERGRAELVVVEGSVDVRPSAEAPWGPARNLDLVCVGHEIQVSPYGRAMLVLPDGTKIRVAPGTLVTVREPEQPDGFWLDLARGILHIIGRDPRELKLTTPYANAGLEGTEFLLEADDREAAVTVIEGHVAVSNEHGALSVPSGRRAVATATSAPTAQAVQDPFDAARWTPYWTRVLDGPPAAADGEPSAAESVDPAFYLYRAESRLAVGKLAEAEADVAAAASLGSRDAEIDALRAMIALARGDKRAAERSALIATEREPASAVAWIAASHVARASFDFAGALLHAARAAELAPRSGAAWVRLAEARLATGDYRGTLAAAAEARRVTSRLAPVDTVLGFAELSASNPAGARTAFERAVAADAASPQAHVGLGLALIAQRRPDEGREQLERAVMLDPANPAFRSYMAKTYADLGRLELNDTQLELAAALDPDDPTPHLYGALVDQLENDPIRALRSMGRATELNGDRAVQRSQFRLDEDLAVRSGGIGRLYAETGFVDKGLNEARKATIADRTDHSAHRLLADLYATQPRHEWARASELFQAQLLEPLKIAPVPARLAEANLFILNRLGPADLTSSEFRPLVRRDGLSMHTSAVAAGNGTHGVEAALGGLHGRVSYSVGYFDLEADGFRANNDLATEVANALVQVRPTPATSLLFELRGTDTEKGMLQRFFDPANFNSDLRTRESVDSLRLGARHDLGRRSTVLASLVIEDQLVSIRTGASRADAARNGATIDVQHVLRGDRIQWTTGIRRLEQDEESVFVFGFPPPVPPFDAALFARSTARHTTLYSYADIPLGERLTTTVGVAADDIATAATSASRAGPKLGLVWEPNDKTAIRASAARTLGGPYVSRHSVQPRLEPTHVAGFNQSWLGSEGDRGTQYGVAIDHRFSERLYAGTELGQRDVSSETIVAAPTPSIVPVERDESLIRSYLHWAPSDRTSVAAEYRRDAMDGSERLPIESVSELDTHRLIASVNHFGPGRLKFGATATYVSQSGVFWPYAIDPAVAVGEYGEDAFWLVDLSLGYRLPNRRGLVALRLDNAFDEDFFYQDLDPENQSLMPERVLSLRFTLAY